MKVTLLFVVFLAGCGVTTGSGCVVGTTGFLETERQSWARLEAVGTPMDSYTEPEKRKLDDIIRKY